MFLFSFKSIKKETKKVKRNKMKFNFHCDQGMPSAYACQFALLLP